MRVPSHRKTPFLTVTLSPTTTSPSTMVCAHRLQLAPIVAPFRMTTNCQTRVPSPIVHSATSASGWILAISDHLQETIVVADVISLVVVMACQHEQHAIRAE